jgi:uncharacterized protein (TIGR03086 family)
MPTEPIELYERASAWTLDKINGAVEQMDTDTACDGWNVRHLLNHMLETQRYFLSSATGGDAKPPGQEPPQLLSDDPVSDFEQGRQDTIDAFGAPGVIEKTGPAIGIAFADQLLHGWDLAKATGQSTAMPEGLAEAAYETVHGAFTDEQRKGVFKPELTVGAGASAQDKLLAYTGRQPATTA